MIPIMGRFQNNMGRFQNNPVTKFVEIFVVICIILVLAGLIFPVFSPSSKIQGEVVDKIADINAEGYRVYLVRIRTPEGELETYQSYYVHDQIRVGHTYFLDVKGTYVTAVQPLPSNIKAERE